MDFKSNRKGREKEIVKVNSLFIGRKSSLSTDIGLIAFIISNYKYFKQKRQFTWLIAFAVYKKAQLYPTGING